MPLMRTIFNERTAKFWDKCAETGKVTAHPLWEFAADAVVRGRGLQSFTFALNFSNSRTHS